MSSKDSKKTCRVLNFQESISKLPSSYEPKTFIMRQQRKRATLRGSQSRASIDQRPKDQKKKKKRTLESIINKFIKTNCIKKKSLQRSETRVVDGERARGRRGGGKSLDRPLDRIKTSTWKLSSRVELRGVKIHTYVLKVEFR